MIKIVTSTDSYSVEKDINSLLSDGWERDGDLKVTTCVDKHWVWKSEDIGIQYDRTYKELETKNIFMYTQIMKKDE